MLQLDLMGRLSREFLCLRKCAISQQINWLEVLQIDGTCMKHVAYNGVALILVGRNGNHKNITVAMALVPKDTKDTFEWFLLNCVANCLKFNDKVVCTDRRHQLPAQVALQRNGLGVNFKFCAWHIALNTKHEFGGDKY